MAGSASDDDRDNFPAAMNQSIYLMLGVPYSALAIVGFLIYRGMRKNEEFRAGMDDRNERMQAKIRDAQMAQIPYMAVVGAREAQAKAVAVRHRREGDLGVMPLDAFAARLADECNQRNGSA